MSYPSFQLRPSGIRITADEIHIWSGVLDQAEADLYKFIVSLSPDEHMRAGQFHFEKDRKWFIARRGILRILLGYYLGVKAHEIQFTYGKNRKPQITERPGMEAIHFNLSHSDGVALFAFTRNSEIGVDIERIRDMSEMEHIVERFFSAGEKTFFYALPQDRRRGAFFTCWTRKEAFMKATGEGLSLPLDLFDASPAPDEGDTRVTVKSSRGVVSDWSIRTLRPACGHVGAFATRSKKFTLRCFKWMTAVAN